MQTKLQMVETNPKPLFLVPCASVCEAAPGPHPCTEQHKVVWPSLETVSPVRGAAFPLEAWIYPIASSGTANFQGALTEWGNAKELFIHLNTSRASKPCQAKLIIKFEDLGWFLFVPAQFSYPCFIPSGQSSFKSEQANVPDIGFTQPKAKMIFEI